MPSYDEAISEIRAECKQATSFKSRHPGAYEEWVEWLCHQVPHDEEERSAWYDNKRIEKRMKLIDRMETERRMDRLDAIKETDKRIERLAQIEQEETDRRVNRYRDVLSSCHRQGCFEYDNSTATTQPQPTLTAQEQERMAEIYRWRNYWSQVPCATV